MRIWYRFDAFQFCQAFVATPDNQPLAIDPVITNPTFLDPGHNSGHIRGGPNDTVFSFNGRGFPLFIPDVKEIQVNFIVQ